jgi:uncharacterized protein
MWPPCTGAARTTRASYCRADADVALLENRPEGHYSIRRVGSGSMMIDDRELDRSFVLTPGQLLAEWPARDLGDIDDGQIARLLALEPDVILLGTGPTQRFPPPALQAAFLRRGVGIEPMDNAAAARTFNLLASEGRNVVALFLFA